MSLMRTNMKTERADVPIVVVLYHREEDTRRMFNQLSRVTEGYSLIIVNNGFDDIEFIRKLGPLHYVENKENTGVIRGINQGLELAEGKYVAVLHNDILIYDDGWLDHIITFMERRPDVGLVGLAGRHTLYDDGNYDEETTTYYNWDICPDYWIPTWEFTEIAAIDGLGWVMRNVGIDLEEGYGMMHCYDLDLSMRYLQEGYSVYAASVDVFHCADDFKQSSRSAEGYLRKIGGDDAEYHGETKRMFARNWAHVLPISRGFRSESYAHLRTNGLKEEIKMLHTHVHDLSHHIDHLQRENTEKYRQLEDSRRYVRELEKDIQRKRNELEEVRLRFKVAESSSVDRAPGAGREGRP
jgi:GT2 family glycosyltransferase